MYIYIYMYVRIHLPGKVPGSMGGEWHKPACPPGLPASVRSRVAEAQDLSLVCCGRSTHHTPYTTSQDHRTPRPQHTPQIEAQDCRSTHQCCTRISRMRDPARCQAPRSKGS